MTFEAMNARLDQIAATFAAVAATLPQAVIGTAQDAAAIGCGFTRRVQIEGGCMGGEFLIHPDADLDDRFRAWGVDWQEWAWVNGWNVLIEEAAAA